jgi:hypothetical protein
MTWPHVDTRWIAGGTSAKNGEKYGGFFGKASYTLSNIANKLSFSEIGAAARGSMCKAAQS